jgi:hypothetical protein
MEESRDAGVCVENKRGKRTSVSRSEVTKHPKQVLTTALSLTLHFALQRGAMRYKVVRDVHIPFYYPTKQAKGLPSSTCRPA